MDILERLRFYQNQDIPQKKQKIGHERNESIADSLNGTFLDPGVLKIESIFPLHFYNPYLQSPESINSIELPILTRGVFSSQIDLNRVVFFDLETTGLAGGTGTYPFLQAYGFLEQDQLKIIQYFLSDFGFEPAAYEDLKNVLSDKNILISYNGKTFDYPLLKNRFILNRCNNLFENFAHLDLLHLARRAWRNQLIGFSMEMIEQKIFLYSRWRDIDGWMIPQAYFEFIRNGRTDDIQRIIRHNQQDLVSLMRLLMHLHMIENINYQHYNTPLELENLCLQAIKKGDIPTVQILLRQCEIRSVKINPALKVDLSLLFKRNGLWDSAIVLWNELIESENHFLFAFEELAKYYEHKQRNYNQALQFTIRALEMIELIRDLEMISIDHDFEKRFRNRYTRLCRKTDHNLPT
jgi:uncharacterized protein YprB with RNaseH-like and TPR domain